ncbi:UvrB/UvrC motif-containing protein [Candidatus Kaiserbacteria bacterium]|nr:UvrB/UvrC motif-containing protein [Candidatus Kaiserbacteria bacterium]
MQKSDLQKSNLPDVPGVYLFKQGREVLYIGKATSLRDRVRSYFDDDLIATRGPRIVDMVTKATSMVYHTTPTVLEALVREAALIKKYMPRANVDGKDDKTFLYAVITEENIPRVLVVRGKDIDFKNLQVLHPANYQLQSIHGPFPSGAQLREGLRLIRKIFPFFDTPKPVIAKSKQNRAQIEFNTQIGQYPRTFDAKEYRRTIRRVMLFLSGQAKVLRKVLAQEMKSAAEKEHFEEATVARQQLFALDHIQDVSLIKDENRYPQKSTVVGNGGYRIEAYDTAHLSGTNAIGVMTVVEDGVPVKKAYRTFRIRGFQMMDIVSPSSDDGLTMSDGRRTNDDIASLKEILSRRLGHPEWPLPKAIVVDGGHTQKKAAERVLAKAGIAIPVTAVVKDERHRPREVIGARAAGISEADAVLANAEAHRFSLARHRAARSRGLRSK